MKENWHDTFYRFLLRAGFIALASFLIMPLVSYSTAQAVESVVCTPTAETDTDGDGFSDAEEGAGLTINGQAYALDPGIPDAFIEVRPASTSILPEGLDLLKYLREGGLNITFHELPPGTLGSERIVLQRNDGTCQKAILVKEVRTPGSCLVVLGKTRQGPVNNDDGPVFLYTDRIDCFVKTTNDCGTRSDCTSITGNSGAAAIIEDFVLNIIAHEGGHRVTLGPIYNSRFGGNHFNKGQGVMMEQASKVTNRKSGVKFYISDQFSDASIAEAVLK